MNPARWSTRVRVIVGLLVCAPVILFVAAYALLFRGSNVAPLASTLATPVATHAPDSVATLAGRWSVTSASQAGYRVREQLGFAPATSDAVGRTTAITGNTTISGSNGALTVDTASFTIDVSQLTSDDSRRDQRIHGIGLETDTFPSAAFTLSSPIAVPATALTGAVVHVTATGDLTLHGVTKRESIPLTVEEDGSNIDVVGTFTFPWADFGMTAPSVGTFVTIQSDPTMEFKLVLQKSA